MRSGPTLKMLYDLPEGRNPLRPRYVRYNIRRIRPLVRRLQRAFLKEKGPARDAEMQAIARDYEQRCGGHPDPPRIFDYQDPKHYSVIAATNEIIEKAGPVPESARRYGSRSRRKAKRNSFCMKMEPGGGKSDLGQYLTWRTPASSVPQYLDSLASWIRSAAPGARFPRRLRDPYLLDAISKLWDKRMYRGQGRKLRQATLDQLFRDKGH